MIGCRKCMYQKMILDEDFDRELKNPNNIRIMSKVCSFYLRMIPSDDIYRCKLVALWKAMVKFNPSGGQKFTSYLYNSIKWECQKELYLINKFRKGATYDDMLTECVDKNNFEIFDIVEKLPPKLEVVIKQKFFFGLTMEEIGKENNYSRETARRYVKKGIEKLQEICRSA